MLTASLLTLAHFCLSHAVTFPAGLSRLPGVGEILNLIAYGWFY